MNSTTLEFQADEVEDAMDHFHCCHRSNPLSLKEPKELPRTIVAESLDDNQRLKLISLRKINQRLILRKENFDRNCYSVVDDDSM